MYNRGSIMQNSWHTSPEGEAFIQKFYQPKPSGKRLTGILERPLPYPDMEEVSYKIQFVGKSGIGKTTVIARLAGLPTTGIYVETPGIRVTDILWPVKIWDKVILFKLQCWDAGADSMKKYSYIPAACSERVDLIVHLFSFSDGNSFSDIPQIVDKISQMHNAPAITALGTRYNQNSKMEVTSSDIRELESKFNVKVLSFTSSPVGPSDVNKVVPILNSFCEQLWARDQQYLINQGVTV